MVISRLQWLSWSLVLALISVGTSPASASDEEVTQNDAEVQADSRQPLAGLEGADSWANSDATHALQDVVRGLIKYVGISPCFEALRNGAGWSQSLSACQKCIPQGRAAALGNSVIVSSAALAVQDADGPVPVNVMYVRFSKSFLEKHLCNRYEQTAPVRDTILGAAVSGSSHTSARTELELLPSQTDAQARLLFRGETSFQTVGVTGPVQIHSRGVTHFVSEKRLWLDGIQLRQTPPVTTAETDTDTLGISTDLPGIFGRLARRVATRQEAESHGQAESISNERTKGKVEHAFDKVVRDYTSALSKDLQTQYAKLPIEGQFAIRELRCSTTPDTLQIVVLGRGDQQPVFADAPHNCANQPEIEVHIHTALVNKAIVNAEVRETITAAVKELMDSPLGALGSTASSSQAQSQDQELRIRWPEAKGEKWLSLSWHATPRVNVQQVSRQTAPSR